MSDDSDFDDSRNSYRNSVPEGNSIAFKGFDQWHQQFSQPLDFF